MTHPHMDLPADRLFLKCSCAGSIPPLWECARKGRLEDEVPDGARLPESGQDPVDEPPTACASGTVWVDRGADGDRCRLVVPGHRVGGRLVERAVSGRGGASSCGSERGVAPR